MNKEIFIFDDIVMDKCRFHYPKIPIWINNVDIDKIMISDKVSFGKLGNKKYKQIRDKINYNTEKQLDIEPVHNDKCIKTKVKPYNVEINTDFLDS